MTQKELIEKCQQYQKIITDKTRERDKALGVMESLRPRFKEEFGCTPETAQKVLDDLIKQENKAVKAAEDAMQIFEKQWEKYNENTQ